VKAAECRLAPWDGRTWKGATMGGSDPEVTDAPETYRQCFMDSSDAIVITDAEGRIVSANPAWLGLYGYTLDEVRGRTTAVVKSEHTTREMYEYMWRQISDPAKGFWKGEIVNRKKNGEEVPLLLTITPIRRNDAIIGYMGIGIDLSERKKLEEMKELYDMVVRHDLKAPLGSILTIGETLASGYMGELGDKQKRMLDRIVKAGKQMLEMIATSLDMAKMERGTLRLNIEDVDLFAAVRTSFENLAGLAEHGGVKLELTADGRPAGTEDRLTAALDPVHLQRCTDNLVKNAIEASPRGETVTVAVAEKGGAGRVRVHNRGEPIPPDVRATLFHPFSTFGKRGGTGLGAYGVKLLTEAMGGTVSYETGESGTTFELAFPLR